ncbi:MAG: group II truncated hemoglobin [Planctomycetota bacterium]|jgi:hemoglobin
MPALPINPQSGSAPSSPFGPKNTPYDAIGGEERVRALVTAFYDHLERDEPYAAARATYPDDLTESREKLYMFLSGWLGGPPLYIQRHGHPRLRGRHMPFAIGEPERDQWLACMSRAMDDLGVEGDLRSFLDARFRHVAEFMKNR